MKKLPSISSEINEDEIFKIINKNFSKIAPFYYEWISSWLVRSYSNFFTKPVLVIVSIYFFPLHG